MSEKRAVVLLALIAIALGATSLAYNVFDDQRLALVGVLVTFVLLVQFASFLADVERRAATPEDTDLLQAFSVHWRRLVEVVVDFWIIVAAFAAAYAVRFGWPGTPNQRHVVELTLPILISARYVAFILAGLYRSIWRFAGSRDVLAIGVAVIASEVVAAGYVGLANGFGDFSRSFFLIDAVFAASRSRPRGSRSARSSARGRCGWASSAGR